MINEKFWLAVAFTAFILLIIKYAWPKIAEALDQKSKQISAEIAEAKALKEKAQKLLEAAEKYLIESEKFAKKLVQDAESEAQKFTESAKKSAELEVEKRTHAALERVKVEEEIAMREVKTHIVSSATKILTNQVANNLNGKQHDYLISQSTEDFAKLIN